MLRQAHYGPIARSGNQDIIDSKTVIAVYLTQQIRVRHLLILMEFGMHSKVEVL